MRLALLPVLLILGLLGAPSAQALKFHPCSRSGFECATLTVPLDYDEPDGRTTKLAVTRLRATDRSRRIGPLLVNYGGPGADAVATTKAVGSRLFRPYLRRFDLVALDPRGTGGRPLALDCKVDQERTGVYNQPFDRKGTAGEQRKVDRARSYANRCERRNAVLAPHVSTANTARDMDRLRRALGEQRITYFGFSYGTLLGATYAAMFPSHARALVLDGALDAEAYLNDPSRNLRNQTAAFEHALDHYFASCRRQRGLCRWAGSGSPEAAYDRLVRSAERDPIPARNRRITKGSRPAVTGDDIDFAVAGELYAKQLWPELTEALDLVARGDGSLIRRLVDGSYGRRHNGTYDPALDRYFMIGAAEQAYGTKPGPLLEDYAKNRAAFPHFFNNNIDAELPYVFFDARDEDVFRGPFALPARRPPALVIGTTHDPATPYAAAGKLVGQLRNARLLTMRGDGHTAYGGNSRCIDRAVDRYVIRLEVPRRGTRCRQTVPFARTAAASAAGAITSVPRSAPPTPLTAPF